LFTYNFGQECYCVDFSKNESKPYFAAAFADSTVRVWYALKNNFFRNLEDFTAEKATNTLDKPKDGFSVRAPNIFGPMDIKINPIGNRLAVSSIDFGMSIYNIDSEKGLTHYRDT